MNLTYEQIYSLCIEFLQRKANLGCAQEDYYSLSTSQRERLRANCQTWVDVVESKTVNDRLAKIEYQISLLPSIFTELERTYANHSKAIIETAKIADGHIGDINGRLDKIEAALTAQGAALARIEALAVANAKATGWMRFQKEMPKEQNDNA